MGSIFDIIRYFTVEHDTFKQPNINTIEEKESQTEMETTQNESIVAKETVMKIPENYNVFASESEEESSVESESDKDPVERLLSN